MLAVCREWGLPEILREAGTSDPLAGRALAPFVGFDQRRDGFALLTCWSRLDCLGFFCRQLLPLMTVSLSAGPL